MAAGSSPISVFQKDPLSVLDYSITWALWLGDDTIASSSWTIPVGLGNAGSAFSRSTTTIWLTGGTAGTSYSVYNTITTSGGRTEKRTIKVTVVDR